MRLPKLEGKNRLRCFVGGYSTMNRLVLNSPTEPCCQSSPLLVDTTLRDLAEDVRELARLCARMRAAAERRDCRQTLGFLYAARGFAYAVLALGEWAKVNKAGFFVEADLDNELWESAVRSVDSFADVVHVAVQETFKRN